PLSFALSFLQRKSGTTRLGVADGPQVSVARVLRPCQVQGRAARILQHERVTRERLDRLGSRLIIAGVWVARAGQELVSFDVHLGADDALATLDVDAADHRAVAREVEGRTVLRAAFDDPLTNKVGGELVPDDEFERRPASATR